MKIFLLLTIVIITALKMVFIFDILFLGNIFLLLIASALIFWMTYAMFFNLDLSGPFSFISGRNQVARWINYFIFLGIYLTLLITL